jgi:hypothetical protein
MTLSALFFSLTSKSGENKGEQCYRWRAAVAFIGDGNAAERLRAVRMEDRLEITIKV